MSRRVVKQRGHGCFRAVERDAVRRKKKKKKKKDGRHVSKKLRLAKGLAS